MSITTRTDYHHPPRRIADVRLVGSTFAVVTCTVDGVPCDASLERAYSAEFGAHGEPEPVVRETRHPSPIVLRGAEVPAEIVAALAEARRLAGSQGLTEEERRNPPPGIVVREPHEVLLDPHFLPRGIG